MKRMSDWTAHVLTKMNQEKRKAEAAAWAEMDSNRKSYVEGGKRAATAGIPIELYLSVARAYTRKYMVDEGADMSLADSTLFLAESWLREGYEQAEKEAKGEAG